MTVFALEWTSMTMGVLVVVVLLALLLVPYLIKEIADGKKELGRLRQAGPGGRISRGADHAFRRRRQHAGSSGESRPPANRTLRPIPTVREPSAAVLPSNPRPGQEGW